MPAHLPQLQSQLSYRGYNSLYKGPTNPNENEKVHNDLKSGESKLDMQKVQEASLTPLQIRTNDNVQQ